MSRARPLGLLVLASVLGCMAGCFGGSQNPGYFPHWLGAGDFVRTHARPIGPSYRANFDPHAVDLEVEPATMTSQVGAQVVILATVRDSTGTPRRSRRVEWIVTGGNLVEVDESGVLPGRGGCDTQRGYSFTSYQEQRMSRGNGAREDDIMLRPGQSWCIVSSPREGDTYVQVVVPGIHNWDKRMKTVVVRWVDAAWEFPPRTQARSAAGHELVTKVVRTTDRQPLTNYRVRYKIVSGPPALLMPNRVQEEEVSTDLSGLAKMRIMPLTAGATGGVNRVSVEIIRPPDPRSPTGTGVTLVTGETLVEWSAPAVQIAPPVRIPDIQLGPPIGQPDPKLGPPIGQPDPKLGPPTPAPPPGPPPSLGTPRPR